MSDYLFQQACSVVFVWLESADVQYSSPLLFLDKCHRSISVHASSRSVHRRLNMPRVKISVIRRENGLYVTPSPCIIIRYMY